MKLTLQQNKIFEQIKAFMNSDASVFILRGYAGTGKTTIVKIIADYINQSHKVLLMAPTGRASRVLSEKTGYKASTIHKVIYEKTCIVSKNIKDVAESEFKYIFSMSQSEYDGKIVAIVDEASMVCSRKVEHELYTFGTDNLLEDLLNFVRPSFGGKVIFVGDPAQLPPVGEPISNALRSDYFKEHGLKVYEEELTDVLRQNNDSIILKNAMMIRDLLEKEKRNCLIFEEKVNDVEAIPTENFLNKYLEYRKKSVNHDSIVICYSNRLANKYNNDIRCSLYGGNVPIRKNDVLIITQNNYQLDRMNGEFVPVLSVGARVQQAAPVFAQVNGEKKRIIVTINFVQLTVPDGNGNPQTCMIIEDLLKSDKATLSIDENRALYINFCMRNPYLKQGSREFGNKLILDPYYNAIRAKYGYAVTGHKCQGGEWGKVFVDFTNRTGLNNDCLRWAYTAMTRARKTLYVTNLPHITPFSNFRIEPIQRCKNIESECRIFGDVKSTPFHDGNSTNFQKAKYQCIKENMKGTPYTVFSVVCKQYMDIYLIQTPNGTDRFDIYYKANGVFLPAKAASINEHTQFILLLLNDERMMPFEFTYTPSDEIHEKLYNLIRSACDGLSIQITNVVEHQSDFNVVYYMRTCETFSYIKVYVSNKGFVTYAKPMSMLDTQDNELTALINEIKIHMI